MRVRLASQQDRPEVGWVGRGQGPGCPSFTALWGGQGLGWGPKRTQVLGISAEPASVAAVDVGPVGKVHRDYWNRRRYSISVTLDALDIS